MSEMLDEFQEMLRDGEWMFRTVAGVMDGRRTPQTVHDAFFARDKEINGHEKDLRRRIVQHLGLGRDADVEACLVLMSVVKDAERVGDYCKNMFEVACLLRTGLGAGRHVGELKRLRAEVGRLFARVREAFAEADGPGAVKVIRKTRDVGWRADQMIERLIRDKMPTRKSVAFALLFRYVKRVAAHLGNICTSVTGSVVELDYAPADLRRVRKTYGSGA